MTEYRCPSDDELERKIDEKELNTEQEDFVLECGREDDYKKMREQDKDNKEICVHCKNIFDVNDLDRCDSDWVCRNCEDLK